MKILKNILAVILGIIGSSIINMRIIELGPHIIATPEGFDNTNLKKWVRLLKLVFSIGVLDLINVCQKYQEEYLT